jgi:hypothetical protein
MEEAKCVNCGIVWGFNPSVEEPNVCMICGELLCSQCYDEDSYCAHCRKEQEQPPYSGVCVECERNSTSLNSAWLDIPALKQPNATIPENRTWITALSIKSI